MFSFLLQLKIRPKAKLINHRGEEHIWQFFSQAQKKKFQVFIYKKMGFISETKPDFKSFFVTTARFHVAELQKDRAYCLKWSGETMPYKNAPS